MIRVRRGFQLLLVVGVLGALSIMALLVVQSGSTFSKLTDWGLSRTTAKLAARSGVEHAIHEALEILSADPLAELPPGQVAFSRSLDGHMSYDAGVSDASAGLDVNDGLLAGRLENAARPLPGHLDISGHAVIPAGVYRSWAVDPWPSDPDNASRHLEDVSALINLRMRRLLNAWGDAWRFTTLLGWPEHESVLFTGASPFGQPFTFTSTAAGAKYHSQPARDGAGQPLATREEILTSSTGLGDRLLAGRPDGGYRDHQTVLDIVRDWGVSVGVVDVDGLREAARRDLVLVADRDQNVRRLARELGPDLEGDGYPDFDSDVTQSRVHLAPLDSHPPDLSDLWRPHAASVVNLNSASRLVRAAVFYAPVNVSYLCEGLYLDGAVSNTLHGVYALDSGVGTLGTGGAVYREEDLRENGFPLDPASNPSPDQVQRRRFMSLRDALVLAQAWEPVTSLETFAAFLRDIRPRIPAPERNPKSGGPLDPDKMRFMTGQHHFDDNAWRVTLPRILGRTRRLPGFLGAPWALLSPYIQESQSSLVPFQRPEMDMCQRRAEDFVHRMMHPKVSFRNEGHVRIVATGRCQNGVQVATQSLDVTVQLLETTRLSSQADMKAHLDGGSSPEIRVGPEPGGVVPSEDLGVIGLNDRGEPSHPSSAPVTVNYPFDDDLASQGSWSAQDPSADPMISPDSGHRSILDSPPGGTYPDFGTVTSLLEEPFDPQFLNQLRTSPRPSDRTWWVPDDGAAALMTMFGLTPAQVESFSGTLPGFPTGGSGDAILWWWFDFYSYDFLTQWPGSWKDGVAPLNIPPDNWGLSDSSLEGRDVSMFSVDGSDLSPFGGVLFSSRNHGPRATDSFTDSLYFRPSLLLQSRGETTPGALFNKGTISLWYRLPSGYQWGRRQRSLVQLDLWEQMEMQTAVDFDPSTPMASPVSPLLAETRPVSLAIQLESDQTISLLHGSGTSSWIHGIDHPVWAGDMSLSTLPFPMSAAALTSPVYGTVMTPKPNGPNWNPSTDAMDWFTRPELDMIDRNKSYSRAVGLTPYDRQPGSWQRVVMSWDLARDGPLVDRYFDNVARNSYAGNPPGPDNSVFCGFNAHMMLTVGEAPGRYWESRSGVPDDNWSSAVLLPLGGYYPLRRCDTLIDNVVMTFGEEQTLSPEGGDPFAAAIDGHPTFLHQRYRIDTTHQPTARFNIPDDSGEVLIVEAEIHDPKVVEWVGLMPGFAFPRVDVHLEDTAGVVTGQEYGHAQYQGTRVTSASGEVVRHGGAGLALTLTWREVSPADQPIDPRVCDIPWVTSVGWTRRLSHVRVIHWEELIQH